MKVKFVDLIQQHRRLKFSLHKAISRVLDSGQYILGENLRKFEDELANFCQVRYAIGVASGTDALLLALKACGVKEGDEVITSAFAFIGTVEAIRHCGAKIVFADIDPATYNIDPQEIKKKITKRTKVIIPVHLYGCPSDMGPIIKLARLNNIKIVEDCAQAIGAEYKGRKVGSLGDVGCISFFPTKNLGCCGDGGIVVTNDIKITEKIRLLRNHGSRIKYRHISDGYNSRLDEVQAAILRVKLKYIAGWNRQRQRLAYLYNRFLTESTKRTIIIPYEPGYAMHTYHMYVIRYKQRKKLIDYLIKKSIEIGLHYPFSLHLQAANKDLRYKRGDFPYSETVAKEVITLPLYPELRKKEILYVIDAINEFVSKYA